MRLETFLVFLLVPFCLAEEEDVAVDAQRIVRAPQGHIQYDDSNGYRVSWKLFAPYTQWTSELENIQSSESKTQDAEQVPETKATKQQETVSTSTVEKQEQQQHRQQIEPAVEYKPYSMVPSYIKQLIFKMYEPQGPYVDPKVYIYHTPIEATISDQEKSTPPTKNHDQEKSAERRQEIVQQNHEEIIEPIRKYSYVEQETASQQQIPQRTHIAHQEQLSKDDALAKITNDYQNPIIKKKTYYGKYPLKEIGHIEYKKEEQESKVPTAQYGFVPPQETKNSETVLPSTQAPQEIMPSLIQQLLNLQAQIPYYVIANRINYKPKKMFIPKPISDDERSAYSYRSKVYYMRDDDEEKQENKSEEVRNDGSHH